MPTTTLTSRDFHQNSAKVKRAAQDGPVIITDRGKPALVLLSYQAYEELQSPHISVADALYMPGAEDIDLPLPERSYHPPRKIDW